MTRHILFSTIGTTPQVVTETIWALKERNPPWRPDEVHIVTTTYALARIRDALQLPSGHLSPMFGGAKAPAVVIHVRCKGGPHFTLGLSGPPDDWSGAPGIVRAPETALNDVNSTEDAAIMGDFILQLIHARERHRSPSISPAAERRCPPMHCWQ